MATDLKWKDESIVARFSFIFFFSKHFEALRDRQSHVHFTSIPLHCLFDGSCSWLLFENLQRSKIDEKSAQSRLVCGDFWIVCDTSNDFRDEYVQLWAQQTTRCTLLFSGASPLELFLCMDNIYLPIGIQKYENFKSKQFLTSSIPDFFVRFLEWKGFQVTTKLSYGIYLVQFPVFHFNIGRVRSSSHFGIIKSLVNIVSRREISF